MNFRPEKVETIPAAAAAQRSAEPAATVAEADPQTRSAERRASLRPLVSLIPYFKRYRWRAVSALAALILAAITTLIVPIAVRRMIDFGFSPRGLALIDSYFLVMIGVGAVLAVASALRYYLVTTLGERIVADLLGDVVAHITSLSAGFFDEAKTGELISRLTADTTQIKAAVGSSVSVALRNFVLFIGASVMMVVSSPRLSRSLCSRFTPSAARCGGARVPRKTPWPMPRLTLPNSSRRCAYYKLLPTSGLASRAFAPRSSAPLPRRALRSKRGPLSPASPFSSS